MKCLLYIPTGEYVSFSPFKKESIDLEKYIVKSCYCSNIDTCIADLVTALNTNRYNPLFIKLNDIQLPTSIEEFEIIEIPDIQKEGTCVNR